ncbi:MAG: terminase large subunit domain-containing protein [Methylocella sp.]
MGDANGEQSCRAGDLVLVPAALGRCLEDGWPQCPFSAVDEVHEHPSPDIIQKLNTATGAQRQPLIFEITTAGHDRHSVFRQHHEYSVKASKGTIPAETSDSWFAYIATIDAGDD